LEPLHTEISYRIDVFFFFFLIPLSYTQAKNLATGAVPTKSALRVLQLQQKLRNSRVVYASATGASDVYQMAYMEKMGLWGPGCAFDDFESFATFVDRQVPRLGPSPVYFACS
jgi:hypothetical protein